MQTVASVRKYLVYAGGVVVPQAEQQEHTKPVARVTVVLKGNTVCMFESTKMVI